MDFHVPVRALYQQMLAHGDPPTWTPALFGGFDLHGEGQVGAYHPLHQIFYRLLPLDVALNLEILMTYLAVVAGTYWFLRRLGLESHGAMFGAMTFGFGGFMLTHFPHINMLACVGHMPWVLGCFDVLVMDCGDGARSRRAAAFAGAALLIGSQVLLGFPQAVWWTLLAGTAFTLWRSLTAGWRRLLAPACAVVVGMLIGGIQLLPTVAAAAQSVRVKETRSFLLGYSLHPWNIVQFWSPYGLAKRAFTRREELQFHEFAIYPAAFVVLAPIWIWVRRASLERRRGLIAAASVFAAVMFVLALGRYGGLARLVLFLPGVGRLRAPARYIVLIQLALAVLAAIAVEDLAGLRGTGVRLSPKQIAAIVSVAILNLLTLLLLNTRIIPTARDVLVAGVRQASVGTIIVVGVTILLLLAARGVRWALPLLIVVTAADLAGWGLTYLYRKPPIPLSEFRLGIADSPASEPLRLAGPNTWKDQPLMSGYYMIGGYVGLYPNVRLSWLEAPYRRLAGTQREIDETLHLVEYTGGVPRARMLTDVRVTSDVAADIEHIDLQRTALVDAALPPLDGDPGTARILVDRPGHFVVHTETTGRQLLSISERYDAGWAATIDGRPASAVRVNGDFLAVVVDRGEHSVELRYQPKALARGQIMSLAGLVALIVGVFVVLRW
jgi:membrane protein YfhO